VLISKNNKGEVTGYLETYINDKEIVLVSVHGPFTTITTTPKSSGLPVTKTFFGKPVLPTNPSHNK
jgi:hypothetical protein